MIKAISCATPKKSNLQSFGMSYNQSDIKKVVNNLSLKRRLSHSICSTYFSKKSNNKGLNIYMEPITEAGKPLIRQSIIKPRSADTLRVEESQSFDKSILGTLKEFILTSKLFKQIEEKLIAQ